MTRQRYEFARSALQKAHDACMAAPGDVLKMSHGPFSGVNKALGLITMQETELDHVRMILAEISARAPGSSQQKCGALARQALRYLEQRKSEGLS